MEKLLREYFEGLFARRRPKNRANIEFVAFRQSFYL